MRCWRSAPSIGGALLLALWLGAAQAGSIEPVRASLSPSEGDYVLAAEFALNLGPRIEEAVARGVPLHFKLEFTLSNPRWYWADEYLSTRTINYRLTYNALTRQYRLSTGGLHQSFASLQEALRVISRVAALPVVPVSAIRADETYNAAVRLSLERSQLPKPFQMDALADKEWQVEAKALRWRFAATAEEAK